MKRKAVRNLGVCNVGSKARSGPAVTPAKGRDRSQGGNLRLQTRSQVYTHRWYPPGKSWAEAIKTRVRRGRTQAVVKGGNCSCTEKYMRPLAGGTGGGGGKTDQTVLLTDGLASKPVWTRSGKHLGRRTQNKSARLEGGVLGWEELDGEPQSTTVGGKSKK